MKIGLRAGHSDNCTGAMGIVNEHEQMKKYYKAVKEVLEEYGHTVIDCNSNGSTPNAELSEGVNRANSNNVDFFASLHMNCFNGQANGTEVLVSSANSSAYPIAQRLANNFTELGFYNRGVKFQRLYEMNHCRCRNIISEICFCDSEKDIAIYNQYSWEQLAHVFCNAIDNNIPKVVNSRKLGWNKADNGLWWYCTDVNNGYYYTANNGWQNIDGEWCYFDADGYAYQKKWLDTNGHWYYLKDNCYMAKDEALIIGDKEYKFNDKGEWI